MRLLDTKLYLKDIDRALSNNDYSYLNNSSILITGGLGLIGSAVVDTIYVLSKKQNYIIDIYVAARDRSVFDQRYGSYDNIYYLSYDALKNIDFDKEYDYIIHSAGLANPDLYINEPVETVLTNIIGVKNLLEYCRNNHYKRFLYISSSEIYGKKESESSFTEGVYGSIDIDDLRSSYPIAKRAAEMLCKSYTSEYGVDTVIVRPGHVYGPSASIKDKRVSSDFAYKAACGLDLKLKSSGLQKRSYIYSVDCAISILTVLKNGLSGQAYNIANEEITTIREMVQYYAKEGNVNVSMATPTEQELKAYNPMNNSSLNNDKIKNIGYKQTFCPKEGFAHTVKILREMMLSEEQ